MLCFRSSIARLTFLGWLAAIAAGSSVSANPETTDIDLTISVYTEVLQDKLYVGLRYRAEGEHSDVVQQGINAKMEQVWERAADYPAVRARPGGYRVWYDDGRTIRRIRHDPPLEEIIEEEPKWIGYQSIRLDGHDIAAVKSLADALQALGLTMADFGFFVSDGLREETQNSLMPDASAKLVSQARRVADAFGARLLAIDEIIVGGRPERDYYASLAMAPAEYDGSPRDLLAGDPVMVPIDLILSGTAQTALVEPD